MKHLTTLYLRCQSRATLARNLGEAEHEIDRLLTQSDHDATIIRALERELAGCREFLALLGGMVAAEGES